MYVNRFAVQSCYASLSNAELSKWPIFWCSMKDYQIYHIFSAKTLFFSSMRHWGAEQFFYTTRGGSRWTLKNFYKRDSELLNNFFVWLTSIPTGISALCSSKQAQVSHWVIKVELEDSYILLNICFGALLFWWYDVEV